MRLLHTQTYELKTFTQDIPPYAILSHTWGEEEVSFRNITDREARNKLKGWSKVVNYCRRADRDGWNYVWIDTCCINKNDTTELGEAINSMFRWYEEAQVCYAYLADVPPLYRSTDRDVKSYPWVWHFRSSRWFTRGWTLQELLAPSFLLFVDCSWGTIGPREEYASEIHKATGIRFKHLRDFRSCNLATKLSWAANRETIREEDRAYSLLGILGVNMTLHYGEGKRAFVRLQRELIRNYYDETILAWGKTSYARKIFNDIPGDVKDDPSIFATSPEMLVHPKSMVTWPFEKRRRGFTIANAGVYINAEVIIFPKAIREREDLYAIKLNCSWVLSAPKSPMMLLLRNPSSNITRALSEKASVSFQRAGDIVTQWNELDSMSWENLGKHDILIREDAEKKIKVTVREYNVVLRGSAENPVSSIGISPKFFCKDPRTQKWKVPTSKHGSFKWPNYHLPRDEALVDKIEIRIPGEIFGYSVGHRGDIYQHRLSLTIVLKCTPRSLSFGIWEDGSLDVTDTEMMNKLLQSDEDEPFPQVVKLPSNHAIRVTATPRLDVSTTSRSFDLAITLEDRHSDRDPPPLGPKWIL
ncbi:heterokaryon incompatibility protein-domain-containing protein [Hypoxylon crocopeplum]|nr:heterokaryon incompatibility protein-domain-containing protein [Hypoxylon crocopeplum]